MAMYDINATTKPNTSMETELYFATSKEGTGIKQIFHVQEVPQLTAAPEPVTYTALESDEEGAAEGKKKYNSIEIPILYVHEQHKALKALGASKSEIHFFVKLPNATAPEDEKPLVFHFTGTVSIVMDGISEGMLKDKLTIYKSGGVEELAGLPASTPDPVSE